jgi:hypothetical protein
MPTPKKQIYGWKLDETITVGNDGRNTRTEKCKTNKAGNGHRLLGMGESAHVVPPIVRNPATRQNVLLRLQPPQIDGVGNIGEMMMSTLFYCSLIEAEIIVLIRLRPRPGPRRNPGRHGSDQDPGAGRRRRDFRSLPGCRRQAQTNASAISSDAELISARASSAIRPRK